MAAYTWLMGELAVIIMWIGAVMVAVAWVLLPFALFGTKPLLAELLMQAKRTNAILESMQSDAQSERSKVAVEATKKTMVELTVPWEK